jgi:transcriptional regulator with XRE-family HTH domain
MQPMSIALAALLDERGMNQRELWAAADLSPATVSLYLKGQRGLVLDHRGARTVEKIAAVLGVAPEFFIEYRVWQIHCLMRNPELAKTVDAAHAMLMEAARLHGLLDEGIDELD